MQGYVPPTTLVQQKTLPSKRSSQIRQFSFLFFRVLQVISSRFVPRSLPEKDPLSISYVYPFRPTRTTDVTRPSVPVCGLSFPVASPYVEGTILHDPDPFFKLSFVHRSRFRVLCKSRVVSWAGEGKETFTCHQ